MNKYDLQSKIRNAGYQLSELNKDIEDLERKITLFEADKKKIEIEQERQCALRTYRLGQIDTIRHLVAGNAISTVVEKYEYMYGNENWSKTREKFEEIIDAICLNISLANDKIQELRLQINTVQNQIYGWNTEISDLEDREREEQEEKRV